MAYDNKKEFASGLYINSTSLTSNIETSNPKSNNILRTKIIQSFWLSISRHSLTFQHKSDQKCEISQIWLNKPMLWIKWHSTGMIELIPIELTFHVYHEDGVHLLYTTSLFCVKYLVDTKYELLDQHRQLTNPMTYPRNC